jgi:hypothetical protein
MFSNSSAGDRQHCQDPSAEKKAREFLSDLAIHLGSTLKWIATLRLAKETQTNIPGIGSAW